MLSLAHILRCFISLTSAADNWHSTRDGRSHHRWRMRWSAHCVHAFYSRSQTIKCQRQMILNTPPYFPTLSIGTNKHLSFLPVFAQTARETHVCIKFYDFAIFITPQLSFLCLLKCIYAKSFWTLNYLRLYIQVITHSYIVINTF